MSRGAAADSFAAPRLIMFPTNTTAFSRGYTLTPLRGWIRDHSEFPRISVIVDARADVEGCEFNLSWPAASPSRTSESIDLKGCSVWTG